MINDFLCKLEKNAIFWGVTMPCSSCKNRHFRVMYYLHHQGGKNE
jgi:hypothetical protein